MSPLTFSLQALLVRHESYIADSERERKTMAEQIETLEKKNVTMIEENRNLLDQLEAANTALTESDAHVVNLQATLQSTQQELQKLSQLAARTEWLEKQLVEFEREQASWHDSIEAKEESEKSAIRRWQKAERTLANLQDEMERIEREAKEERERHREIVERMERRHSVEKELGSAAGRLKGAAALKNGSDTAGPTVVSHFVKDILQDNANLQMGIVELREMLNNSNEEVETLRQQLQLHQPADEEEERSKSDPGKRKDVREEMTRANSQELHVHHHYHAPPAPPAPPKPQPPRRPRKKRIGAFVSGYHTPPSGASTPRSSFSYGASTPAAAILQQTAASVPQSIPARNRWSTQSNATYHSMLASSGPSTPQSTTNRTSSIFDRVFSDAGLDSSRPTTPDTEEPGSPVYVPTHAKRGSQSSFRTHSAPIVSRSGINAGFGRPTLNAIVSVEELPRFEESNLASDAIPEAAEHEWEDPISPDAEENSNIASPLSDGLQSPSKDQSFHRPTPLRRATSHESLFSVSGMDIHTLKSRPSQLLAPRGPYGGRGITTQAVISDATATATAARPSALSRPTATGKTLLSGMAGDQRAAAAPSTPIGKKVGSVGGWLFGKWGATPAPTSKAQSADSTPVTAKKISDALKADKAGSTSTVPANKAVASKTDKTGSTSSVPAKKTEVPKNPDISKTAPKAVPKPDNPRSITSSSGTSSMTAQSPLKGLQLRPPGINQSGPLLGYFPEPKSPPKVPVVKSLDAEALREMLEGT